MPDMAGRAGEGGTPEGHRMQGNVFRAGKRTPAAYILTHGVPLSPGRLTESGVRGGKKEYARSYWRIRRMVKAVPISAS